MRRRYGSESWHRLLEWDRGSTAAERLAAHILRHEGFLAVDPSHPLGGPDRLRDVACKRGGRRWVGAAYFPRNQQDFRQVAAKFRSDHEGVAKHDASGFAFVTNQELSLDERSELTDSVECLVELFHLERLSGILDQPAMYGVRLEFLDIEMTKEEQLAFFAARDESLLHVKTAVERMSRLLSLIAEGDEDTLSRLRSGVPLEELREFREILDSVVGDTIGGLVIPSGPIRGLHVPLEELREFREILDSLVGDTIGSLLIPSGPIRGLHVPLEELREFEETTKSVAESIAELDVPLDQIRQYENILDRIVEKSRKLKNNGA